MTSNAHRCDACPHVCDIEEGSLGTCRARTSTPEGVTCSNYGRATSLALDPVEKKPLALWKSGSYVLSVGSYGCNMACPFCQNYTIAMAGPDDVRWEYLAPEDLVEQAVLLRERDKRVVGVAFTYNEPLAGWEYVRDASRLAHEEGLANVLVSNGQTTNRVLRELTGLIDAANIDVKAADQQGYDRLGGNFAATWNTVETLAADPVCHLEITTLVVPSLVDDEVVDTIARKIASLDPEIPYHLSRFFGRHLMADADPTPVRDVYRAAEIARRHLRHVFVGNC